MGRAERRRKERRNRLAYNKESIRVTRDEIQKIEDTVQQDVTAYSTEALLTCFILANRRLYGHGAVRSMRTLEYIDDLMGAIIRDEATIEEYKDIVKDEMGVVVKFGG